MAMRLKDKREVSFGRVESFFDLDAELRKHSWSPKMSLSQVESALKGKNFFTYLIRPSDLGRGFAISFVQKNGYVKHDYFTLINSKIGMWRNGQPSHVGSLAKVIRDMMNCRMDEGQPLS